MPHDRNKISLDLGYAQFSTLTRDAIEGIAENKLLIHRIVLSSERVYGLYNYDCFKELFPTLRYCKNYVPDKRMPFYKKQYIVKFKTFKLIIFDEAINYRPPFRIEIIPVGYISISDHKSILASIDELIPNMTVASVEYAIDLILNSPEDTQVLFLLMRRALYAPYQKNAVLFGESLEMIGNKIRVNAVYKVDDIKIYERGDDNKKKGEHWDNIDVNKVRLEYTAAWDTLRKNKISSIADFNSNCHFYDINHVRFKFKHFKGSRDLPSHYIWKSYSCKDSNGNSGAFQTEYLHYTKLNNGYRQSAKDIAEFDPLIIKLHEEMKLFDLAWGAADII